MAFEGDKSRLKHGLTMTFIVVGLMWLIKVVELFYNENFVSYGVFPRHAYGLVGIVTSPFVHADIYHLISNTIPLIILIVGIYYFYPRVSNYVLIAIYVMSGLLVWLIGRESYHIGASGLVYGLMMFIFTSGFIRKDARSLAISFIVLLIYGSSLFTGIFPGEPNISWEAHLSGFLVGLVMAVMYRNEELPDSINMTDIYEESNSNDYEVETDKVNDSEVGFVIHFPKSRVDSDIT